MEVLASEIAKQGTNPLHLQQRQFERFFQRVNSSLIAELYREQHPKRSLASTRADLWFWQLSIDVLPWTSSDYSDLGVPALFGYGREKKGQLTQLLFSKFVLYCSTYGYSVKGHRRIPFLLNDLDEATPGVIYCSMNHKWGWTGQRQQPKACFNMPRVCVEPRKLHQPRLFAAGAQSMPFQCTRCVEWFRDYRDFLGHVRLHCSGRPFSGRSSKDGGSLILLCSIKELRLQSSVKTLLCRTCNSVFTQPACLEQHMHHCEQSDRCLTIQPCKSAIEPRKPNSWTSRSIHGVPFRIACEHCFNEYQQQGQCIGEVAIFKSRRSHLRWLSFTVSIYLISTCMGKFTRRFMSLNSCI